MKTLCLVILILTCSITSSFAVVGTPNEIFRPLAKKQVQDLLDRGVDKVGKLSLKKLIIEMDEVEWRTFDIGFLGGSGGNRQTSIYLVDQKMVVINMLTLQNMVGKPVPMYSWAIHESLGALGYPDEDYEISSSITYLANSEPEVLKDSISDVKDNFIMIAKATSNRLYSGDGGATVVGGGGDAVLIELKQRLLKHYKEWIKNQEFDYSEDKIAQGFSQISKLKMEFDRKSENYNSTAFTFNGKMLLFDVGADRYPEKIYTEKSVYKILDTIQDYLFN